MKDSEKLVIINELIRMRGKVQRSMLTLMLKGEDTADLEKAERELEDKIRELRGALQHDWQGEARAVQKELQNANKRVQGRVRDIERDVKRAEKATEIMGQVEGLMTKIATLLT